MATNNYNSEATIIQQTLAAVSGDEELSAIYGLLSRTTTMSKQAIHDAIVLIKELKTAMQHEVVSFTFKKKDGSIRQAYGTRAEDVLESRGAVPDDHNSKSGGASTFSYFDIEKGAWRCFRTDSLMYINNAYTL